VGRWWASAPRERWPSKGSPQRVAIEERWKEPWGDRLNEVVFIGRQMDRAAIEQAWKVERTSKGVCYRIDATHPSVSAVLDDVTPIQKDLIFGMLRVIEETVPVQKIWLDTTENKDTPVTSFASSSDEAILKVMETLYRNLVVRKGMSTEDAKSRLACTDPFQNFPHLIAQLSDPES
jgi:hypothetical protein